MRIAVSVLFFFIAAVFGQFEIVFYRDSSCVASLSSAFPFIAPSCISAPNSAAASVYVLESFGLLYLKPFAAAGCVVNSTSHLRVSPGQCASISSSLFARVALRPRTTSSPIFGIVGEPDWNCESRKRGEHMTSRDAGKSCFASYYSDWLSQAGARVVPLPWNVSDAEVSFFGARLNGVLFTGGGLVLDFNDPYVLAQKKWFDFAVATAKTDDPFLLWGTCQGFQLLNVLAAQSKDAMCLECFDAEDIALPLDFTAAASFSFYSQLSAASFKTFESKNISMNFHHDGVEPRLYAPGTPFPALPSFFRLLSTNTDRKGRLFASSVQGVFAPNILGVQFHAERPAFEFSSDSGDAGLPHSREAIHANNEIGQAIVDTARLSKRSFASWSEAEQYLLYNLTPKYLGMSLLLYTY